MSGIWEEALSPLDMLGLMQDLEPVKKLGEGVPPFPHSGLLPFLRIWRCNRDCFRRSRMGSPSALHLVNK